ncbi:phosphoribosylformylglycinamidine cyclo-ligase [Desulfovibrio inopinatus]|uniref:phosphoribosylformylglycinamidine cyclo-ligase n=1 Tax=Desulfovibrio inopinatus TaxID=102109 RepID=UPI00040BD40E|nr:phosphoribosylformylglycinamidine cyclo-ligase [Desulfovibrio inopinatus]
MSAHDNRADRTKAYKEAGVDIDAGESLVKRIRPLAQKTFTQGVITDIGGFGGLFKLNPTEYTNPVLVSATDGVGTKLKLTIALDGYSTIGIDLVAMSVNDILVQGAKPLFFLDYFATGKLDVDKAAQVIEGIAEGCTQSECALLGGETAEMPDCYPPGEFDIAGFCVGIVDSDRIIDGSGISAGDAIIGIKSSGPHSNGYTLIRKLLAKSGLSANDPLPGDTKTVGEALLAPTRIYVKPMLDLLRDVEIKGMAHITGGGFYDNIPRILPKNISAKLDMNTWEVDPVFHWLRETGEMNWEEMLQIFNCGIGYILVVSKEHTNDILHRLNDLEEKAFLIGYTDLRKDDTDSVHITLPA